ncbi:MAG: hypothetical protein HY764_04685 [Candidatus Portnoybacteria bacterium]|nr:hypothetical protein [Candidatus Portnoybacteria bacterium]
MDKLIISKITARKKEKGAVATLVAIIVMGAILLIALGLSNIFIAEIKMSSLVRQSGAAFYAAEAGTEYALYKILKADPPELTGNFSVPQMGDSEASFNVSWDYATDISSVGSYGRANRKIKILWTE